MSEAPNNLTPLISRIASTLFALALFVGLLFLWCNAPAPIKRDMLGSAAIGLEHTGTFLSTLFQSRQTEYESAQSKNHLAEPKLSLPIPEFEIPEPPKVSIMPVPPFAQPSAPKIVKVIRKGKPVQFVKTTVANIPLYETIIDLKDPETFIGLSLANDAVKANDKDQSHGDEPFDSLVKKAHGSVVINGTFFSKDLQKRVMGNMISGGKFLKYSQWENFGTTFGLTEHNIPVMITARVDGTPNWDEHWFSLTCGPRLLKDGEIWVYPEKEGFTDSHVTGIGPRCALGYTQKRDKLILCTFLNGLSLTQEAHLMKELGCAEALNLDGGASRALAYNGSVVVPAGRPLTNVLVVYDAKNKAPQNLITSWEQFQKGARPSIADQ